MGECCAVVDDLPKTLENGEQKLVQMIFRQINQNELDGYVYRGEGNANIVITLPLTRSVLRFRKIKSIDSTPPDGGKSRVEFELWFFRKFISKHMGIFVMEHEIISCHPNDISDWNEKVEPFRPHHRKQKSLYERYATKIPDYALLPMHLETNSGDKPTICIEIKPKQGYIPEADRHMNICPYCAKQFYKEAKAMISKRSRYCPCELFSGENSRVISAIDALVESPQNNLTVFKNGRHVWGETSSRHDLNLLLTEWLSCENYLEIFYHLIAEALLRRFPLDRQNSQITSLTSEAGRVSTYRRMDLNTTSEAKSYSPAPRKKCQFSTGNLPEGSVLERIYRMQELHSSDAETVHNIYSSDPKYNERTVFLEDTKDEIKRLRNYLLFKTARDCSILISFQEAEYPALSTIPKEHIITLPNQRRYYVFNIGVSDLDPKSFGQIEKHREITIDTLNAMSIGE